MNELENLYQQLILEQSKARHGAGTLPGWAASSHQVNPTCGDEVTLQVEVADGKLRNLVWDGHGCSISQASLSMMWELVQGQDLETVHGLEQDFNEMMHSRGRGVDEDLLDRLGDASSLEGVSRYVNRVKCALLGWMALKDALAQAAATDGTGGGTQAAPHCDSRVMNRTCDPKTTQNNKGQTHE